MRHEVFFVCYAVGERWLIDDSAYLGSAFATYHVVFEFVEAVVSFVCTAGDDVSSTGFAYTLLCF